MSDRVLSLGLGLVLGATFIALAPSCLDRRDEAPRAGEEARCASCHGDAERAGDFLQRSAPPRDLFGASDTGYPGVGAHAVHLYASSTHAEIACSECHRVPETVDAPGHADDARPAELEFGPLARTGARAPSYDGVARTCSDTWCHREAKAVWTEPRDSAEACGSCHGLPPPAPHPQSDRCSTCHGSVVDANRNIAAPALHVDGIVQFDAGGCTDCHGSGDDPAPPVDLAGNTSIAALGVGAHQAHLGGGSSSRALACAECHSVPATVDAPGHADDALPAEVALTGVATTGGRTPVWDRTLTTCSESWCHAPSPASSAPSPSWIEGGPLACTSCHGAPPAPPHPQMTDCSRCHGEVVSADDVTMLDASRHVDGVVDVTFDTSCTACHGGANPAPPVDLAGGSLTTSPGVGAHQIHLAGTPRSRAVACEECHVVPNDVLVAGHVDTPSPAEVTFSGTALAFGATPAYSNASCSGTPCHGAVFPNGHASGGSNTAPVWTVVDGTQAACGTCHALPPPAPHPKAEFNPVCSACHQNIAPDNLTFTDPSTHVDGVVTFILP